MIILRNIKSVKIVDFEKLHPFLRVLLVTDNTVTSSLEAFFGEDILVNVISQKEIIAGNEGDLLFPHLNPPPLRVREGWGVIRGENIIQRDVLLMGSKSKKAYVYAESILRPDSLDESIRRGILEGRIGIGDLLNNRRLETFREILSIDSENAGEISGRLSVEPYERLITRCYIIYNNKIPIIQVKEKFSEKIFT